MYRCSEQILDHFLGRDFQQRRVVHIHLHVLERGGVIIPVAHALVHDGHEVNVLALDRLALAVELDRLALGAEGDEHRQGAEVIQVVIDRRNAERAHVGDDHRAVEGAGVEQLLRDDAEVIHHAQTADGEAQQETRQLQQRAGDLLGVVVLAAELDLVDLLVHLAVDVKDRVRRGKDGLDGRLIRGGGHAAAHGQHDLDVVACIDAPAGHEAIDAMRLSLNCWKKSWLFLEQLVS